MPRLTILSDRRKSIVDAVELNFPTAFHGFCMLHLSESFRKEFNNTLLVNLLWEAANALTVMEFEAKLLEIEEISQDASYWVRRVPPRLWANSHFEGTRFGNLTANVAESLNAWILEASGLPIVQMMECIRRQLMTWFNERREASTQWTSVLVPSAERQVSEALERARTYQNVHRFAESCFTVATYRNTYSQTIHPVPDKTLWREMSGGPEGEDSTEDIIVNPPKSLRPPGQPRKKTNSNWRSRSGKTRCAL
ncbi:hypothetical protein Sango_0393500 [Sesamum angolense]|uniref:Protein FAR1-RELATED SEQUENCE n=1 Tax=Sesamum angolense TaxID=2727404 RepID=A0AAE2C498_9LAMI|nr:hypothetical protein Sango_0393500 [Sesamum angolense]